VADTGGGLRVPHWKKISQKSAPKLFDKQLQDQDFSKVSSEGHPAPKLFDKQLQEKISQKSAPKLFDIQLSGHPAAS